MIVDHFIVKFYFFLLISFPLFHWAHRFRYVVVDMGLMRPNAVLAVICYGTAILGTALTIYFLGTLK